MIINIDPLHFNGLDCLEDQVLSIVSWAGRKYYYALAGSWQFKYNNIPNGLIGDKIIIDQHENLMRLLERFCGINFFVQKFNSADEAIIYIDEEIRKALPVIICIDSYWCPWDELYLKRHHRHYCIVEKIDKETKKFVCVDAWYNKKDLVLPFENFYNSFDYCISVIINPTEKINIDWKANIIDTIHNLQDNRTNNGVNAFDMIKSFSKDLSANFNFHLEMGLYESLWESPIFINITNISNLRLKYYHFLECVSQNIDSDISEVLNSFIILSSKWKLIGSLLVKANYTQKPDNQIVKISGILDELAGFEEHLANTLLKAITNPNKIICMNKDIQQCFNNSADNKLVFINLESFFNNNGFGTKSTVGCKADLSGTGFFFLSDEYTKIDIWKINNLEFNFPQIVEDKNDNISCNGQTIHIPNKIYKRIMLLGCSEWGSYCENMIIEYKNGYKDTIRIGLTDLSDQPAFNEYVIWNGAGVYKKEDKVILNPNVRLYAKEYKINTKELINSISLPNSPNMHIFAITLEECPQ